MELSKETVTELYRHMEWADARQWTAVLASEPAHSDAKLRDYLFHMHMVQRAFLRVWRNEARELNFPTFKESREMIDWARSYYAEIFDHLSEMPADIFSEQCNLPWAGMVEKQLGYSPSGTTVCETVLQVVLHSTYHRLKRWEGTRHFLITLRGFGWENRRRTGQISNEVTLNKKGKLSSMRTRLPINLCCPDERDRLTAARVPEWQLLPHCYAEPKSSKPEAPDEPDPPVPNLGAQEPSSISLQEPCLPWSTF
jgi:hypothetical protein